MSKIIKPGGNESMIYTGLPYSFHDMPTIVSDGAIVDMSDLHFPSVPEDKQTRTAFIFLRNTNFKNIQLDFSRCSPTMIVEYIKEYLTTDIQVKNEELSDIVLYTLANMLSVQIDLEPLIKNNIILEIQGKLANELKELKTVLASLPLYLMYRSKLNNNVYSLTTIKTDTLKYIGPNFLNLLHDTNISLIVQALNEPPVFYSDIFTDTNNDLFDALCCGETFYSEAFYMLQITEPNMFTKLMKAFNEKPSTL